MYTYQTASRLSFARDAREEERKVFEKRVTRASGARATRGLTARARDLPPDCRVRLVVWVFPHVFSSKRESAHGLYTYRNGNHSKPEALSIWLTFSFQLAGTRGSRGNFLKTTDDVWSSLPGLAAVFSVVT